MNVNLLANQMDYLFFCYGASFVFLGAVCLAIMRCCPDVKKLPWTFLGFFGFLHGCNEWLDMIAISLEDNFYFRLFRLVILIFSFICLVEFTRRGAPGRRIGGWLYVLLFTLASFGALYGWEGVNASSRYCFGLVGVVGAALVIISFTDCGFLGFSRLSSNLLKIAGFFLFLYGLATGLVVPYAKFFPANFINTESFLALTHLPIQLFRAIFAFITTACFVLYAVNQSLVVFLKQENARRKSFIIISVVSVFIILLALYSGWLVVDGYGKKVAKEENEARHLKIKVLTEFLHVTIGKLGAIEALSNSPDIRESMIDITAKDNLDKINEHLDRYKIALDADVCYVMDVAGLTVASSNRYLDKSFVGSNYSFRPYFKQALKEGRGIYLAKGITSEELGIYVSFPIFDMSRKYPVGVIAAKALTGEIEQFFRTYEDVFLVSPEGVIFISSRPELILRSIRDLSPNEKENLRSTRQFGYGPWDSLGLGPMIKSRGVITYQEKQYSYVFDELEELPGWKIYLLDSHNRELFARFIIIMIFLSFFLFASVISLFIFRVSLDTLRLSASEALYAALFENSPYSIKVMDKFGKCISVNKSGLHMMGWKKEDVVGRYFEDLWPSENQGKVREAVQGVMDGVQQNFEAHAIKSDSSEVIKSVTLAPIYDTAGEVKYFIAISRDITEERRTRERLMHSSKVATVGALATGVSHEFNNVLEIILCNAELAYVSKDTGVMRQSLKIIIDSARRAAWIIKSMLDFSGKSKEVREFVDLADILKKDLVLLDKIFESNSIKVETYFKEAPRIFCNAGQMSQVFVNIMMNARDAMRGLDSKRLVVSLDYLAEQGEVSVSFLDTGRGINEELKNKLFGPFVTTKGLVGGGEDKQPGIGLGLFVAYGIVKQHNGSIAVESEYGKGAKFTVFLPVMSGKPDESADVKAHGQKE